MEDNEDEEEVVISCGRGLLKVADVVKFAEVAVVRMYARLNAEAAEVLFALLLIANGKEDVLTLDEKDVGAPEKTV